MNYFKLFELIPSYQLNQGDLHMKYLQLQKKYHPDNAESTTDQLAAVEQTILINDAFDVLSNPVKLIEYYLDQQGIKLTDKQVQENLDQTELLFLLDLQEQFMDNPTKLNEYKAQIKVKIKDSTALLVNAIEQNSKQDIEQNLAKVLFFSKSLKHMG